MVKRNEKYPILAKYEKKCAKCDKIRTYKNRENYISAMKRDALCQKCVYKHRKNPLDHSINAFKGKHHTEQTKLILSTKNKGKKQSKKFCEQRKEYTTGSKNPMFGKTFYQVWVEKHGTDIADQKLAAFKAKQSKNNSGKNNPMYGKPCPDYIGGKGGSGWKGYYNGTRFLSIRECYYMITLDENHIPWTTAEHLKIEYIGPEKTDRTYTPDFVINNDTIIEIKPLNRQNNEKNQLKWIALQAWAKNNNMKCEVVDVKLNDVKILEYFNKGLIRLDKNTLPRFKKYYKLN